MANYTKLNLRAEVENQSPKFGITDMEFRSARVPLEMQNAEIIAFGAPNTGPGDGPVTQDWWTD